MTTRDQASIDREAERLFWLNLRADHPRFLRAVAADARVAISFQGGKVPTNKFRNTLLALRLMWEADAFFALVLYRARAALQRRRVPIVPRLLHRWSMSSAQICIGDPVHLDAGVYIPHGQVVIDGITRLGSNTVISPFVTIGLRAGDFGGPVIREWAEIGTGAKVIGSVTIGESAKVGANAVVVHDVAPRVTVVGQPARPANQRPTSS